jgi:hypothetical protein
MKIDGKLIVTEETKAEALKKLDERMKELDLKYTVEERPITLTELTVTLDISKLKVIKHIFTLVKAPEEEIKYLTKVKSIVVATAKDILTQVLQSIKG